MTLTFSKQQDQDRCRRFKSPRLRLNLNSQKTFSQPERAAVLNVLIGLPELFGSPIFISALPKLTAHRGRLLSADPAQRGTPVHAASFLRKREIVLETELLASKTGLQLILVHELFHFVWLRLGNPARQQFRDLLERELKAGARGEIGESAEVHKLALRHRPPGSAKLWRDYVCESFCDSAAWLYAGAKSRNGTLGVRWRRARQRWFEEIFARPRVC